MEEHEREWPRVFCGPQGENRGRGTKKSTKGGSRQVQFGEIRGAQFGCVGVSVWGS